MIISQKILFVNTFFEKIIIFLDLGHDKREIKVMRGNVRIPLDFSEKIVYNGKNACKGMKVIKKIGIMMGLCMGVTLSFFLSLVGTLTSGHFTVQSWLISFLVSFVISMVIGLIVPLPKIEAAVNGKLGLKPGSVKANLMSALISNTIYTPLMSVLMSVIMITASTAGLEKQIAAADDELAGVKVQISEVQSELSGIGESDPQKSGELQAKLGELNGKQQELTGKTEGMRAAKPNMGMAILMSVLICYPIGYVIIFIVQPLYLRMLLKKYGPPPGGPVGPVGSGVQGGPPAGMPPKE